MRIMMSAASAAAGVLALCGPAHAQDAGLYLRGELGGSFEGESDANDVADVESGVAPGLRAQDELPYLQKGLIANPDGDTSSVGGFANLIYEFNRDGSIRPFLGAGLGVTHVDMDNGIFAGDGTGLAYQAKAGHTYKIDDRLSLELGTRHVVVTDPDFGSGASGLKGDFDSQAVTISLHFKLD